MSFITKKHIPRRTFLKGAGVTLALPLLEAMVPASTALAQTVAGQPKTRFVGVFFPHGMAPGHWEPEVEGALPEKLPYILESLEKLKDQTVVLNGLWSQSAEPPEGTTGSDHWVAAAFLTAIKPRKTAGSDATVGSATIDQLIAQKIGQETLLPSLQLACEDPNSSSSNCGEGYSCSYTNSISWVELPTPENETVPRTSPLPMELNPQVVFERLFGSGSTPEVRAQRMKQSQSILDSLVKELGDAPQAARARRCAHGEPVHRRDPRDRAPHPARRQGRATMSPISICRPASRSSSTSTSACTRTWSRWRSRPTSPASRRCSARATSPAVSTRSRRARSSPRAARASASMAARTIRTIRCRFAVTRTLNRYHVSTMAYLAKKLKATPDGDGNLLDRSLIMYGTNMGNSNQHQHYDVAHLLVGGANGQLKGNRHLKYDRKTVTTGNLLLSVLDMFDIKRDKQGDSTGRLPKLV